MNDPIQQGLQTLATQNTALRDVFIACAVGMVYLLALIWIGVVVWHRTRLTLATAARITLLAVLAYLASLVLTRVIIDPRPYLATHTQPLIAVARDNGFPSDHVLLAAVLTAGVWWLAPRLLPAFAGGTLLLMLGRLGVGAHHTLDVVGSVVIVIVAALIVRMIPLPAAWRRTLLGTRRDAQRDQTPTLVP